MKSIKDAKLIWLENEYEKNTWMCFRKKVTIGKVCPENCTAFVAVDTKYWLYVNGEMAVREGGLKRGPSKNGTYYEQVDLSGYFHTGENTIAILVNYFGKNGFSHVSSGMPALAFAMGDVVSDSSFKAMKHPAYVPSDESDPEVNFRIPESDIYFDANKDIAGWYLPDFDDSDWQNAVEIDEKKAGDWGEYVLRITPQLKDFGLKTVKTKECAIRLPYNAQFTPYFRISAKAGLKIMIKTDSYTIGVTDEKSLMSVYYTKEGEQEYEALGWLSGEWLYLEAPEDVKILELGYRETGYNTEIIKDFKSADPFWNKLWDKCVRTLYITMRDTFMDCPDRERVQWWDDATIEMQEALCCMDERALLLYKKGVQSLAGWAKDGNHMMTVVPSGTEQFELPMQNLAGICGFAYYYKNTNDLDVPKMAYDMSMEYLRLFDMSSEGLVVYREGSWDWPDWGENSDSQIMENAWYYMALKATLEMADALHKHAFFVEEERYKDDCAWLCERTGMIENAFDGKFYNGSCYYYSTANGKPDDRANALAVLSGLAPKEAYEGVMSVLLSTENASPYMEKYVLDAMCVMGENDAALDRIKRRYKAMVDEDYSTLWEYWNKDGTKNHAWSGGPLIIMDKIFFQRC